MRDAYKGPRIEELPHRLKNRVRKVKFVAEEETDSLYVFVSKHIEQYKGELDKLWTFGDYREVFAYSYGTLDEAYFKMFDTVYTLTFYGTYSPEEMEKVEKVLGLNVIKRPIDNQDKAEIRIKDVPLERLVDFDSNIPRDLSVQSRIPIGPYMGRK